MHQIVQIVSENFIFSPLIRGHIPLRRPLCPQVLLVPSLGAVYIQILDPRRPCYRVKRKQGLQGRKLQGHEIDGGGGVG